MTDELIPVHDWWDYGPYGGWNFGHRDDPSDEQPNYMLPRALVQTFIDASAAESRAARAIDDYIDGHPEALLPITPGQPPDPQEPDQ